jgi:hypothetical protein
LIHFQKYTKAPQAAGTIHSDFEKGFICAEVMKYPEFKELGPGDMQILLVVFCIGFVIGQDPAGGWMGYATATNPGGGRITYIEATWINGNNPKSGGAFFSPWFGIEASDNLNLIQPVNPWVGDHWEIYNEYFQWSPEKNQNSQSNTVSPGDVIFGSVTFNQAQQTYTVYHQDKTSGWSVTTNFPVQRLSNGD